MAVFETWLKSDLKKPVIVESLNGNLFSADNEGNKIGVEVFDDGSPASLSGNVTGYVIRSDGATVVFTGTLSGNKASIVLPSAAYAIVGWVSIVIKVGTVTVGACTAYVYQTTTDELVDPEHIIPSIEELYELLEECEAAVDTKADKVTGATSGNFAGLDSSGNLTDSGKKPADYMLASARGSTSGVASLDANTKVPVSQLPTGVNNGIASLDANGKVPVSQIPAAVHDILEYGNSTLFPATGEAGRIYVAQDTNKTYRWNGTAYVEISPSIALGETDETAYRGDRGKAAYDHATDAGRVITAQNSGFYKLSVTGEGHVGSVTPVQKSDIEGLGIPGSQPDISGKADLVELATNGNFAGLNADGNLTDSGYSASDFLTDHQDISGKADKVTNATNGNFAGLDANGNLTDSGSKASDFITSHQDISGKADKVNSAISGNFAGLDAYGNLTDSGHKHSDYLTSHQDISGKADKVQSATNGHLAGLDSNGNLTDSGSSVSDLDDVLEYASASAFPASGTPGKIYVAKDANELFRWDTTLSEYVSVGGGGTTISDFVGATSSADGSHGLVPAPLIADKDKFLKGDGSWSVIPNATQSTAGLMSADDKAKSDIFSIVNGKLCVTYYKEVN